MPISFVVAVNRFFGRKDGQTLGEFAVEIRQLTDGDKIHMARMLSEELKEEVVISK